MGSFAFFKRFSTPCIRLQCLKPPTASVPFLLDRCGLLPSSFGPCSRLGFSTSVLPQGKSKSEATFLRKVYASSGSLEIGVPTFTIFTESVCLTLKATNEDGSTDHGILFTGMKRLQGPSRQFNKGSRVSSVLPLDQFAKLRDIVDAKSNQEFILHGIDGGSVVVNCSQDAISITLHPSLIPGQSFAGESGSPPSGLKLNAKIDFLGGQNEVTLLSFAVNEISESLNK